MMAEAPPPNNSIEIPIPGLSKPLHVTGALTSFAIVCVVVAYMLYEQYKDIKAVLQENQRAVMAEQAKRSDENNRQMEWLRYSDCRIQLDIWVHTQPTGKEIYFSSIPEPLRFCFPQIIEGKDIKR